eukprot:jgi/Tetstr1/428938/TSEL_018914.t1
MAASEIGGQGSGGALHAVLRVAIALQVLLLLEFFWSFTPHTHTSAGHQKLSAQRVYHSGKPAALPPAASPSALPGADEGQPVPALPGDAPQGAARAAEASRTARCQGAPKPWEPAAWRSRPAASPDALRALLDPPAVARRRLQAASPRGRPPATGASLAARAAARARERRAEAEARKGERVAQHAAAALEDERRSVGPRLSWCERERLGQQRSLQLSPEEVELARCLREPHSCRLPDARLRQVALSSLPGLRKLGEPLPCLFANGMTCPINATVRNLETGYAYETVPFDLPIPDRDPVAARRFSTCAVVGNGAGVMSSPGNGAAIDAHEAVFRFNDMLRLNCLDPDSPNRVLCNASMPPPPPPLSAEEGRPDGNIPGEPLSLDEIIAADDRKYAPFTGRRTTFRAFLLWHYALVAHGAALAREFPENRVYFLSSNMLNWQMQTYSMLRRDLYGLGLGAFPCYSALSSGLHGLLLALQSCDAVSLFGFSVDLAGVTDQVHFRPIAERPSAAHSWAFDTLLLRLLDLTGRVTLCTA